MKTILLTVFIALGALFPLISKAQFYNIISSKETYSDLDNPVYLARTPFDPYDDNFTLPVGFHFLFFGKDRYSLLVSKDGYVSTAGVEVINAFQTYLKDNGRSSLSYEITGSENCNNQVLKIQWKNMGRFCDSSGAGSFNFQIWIYQTSNVIEFHYGNHSDTAKFFSQCLTSNYLHHDYAAFLQDSNLTSSPNIDSFSDSGTVVRFFPSNPVDLNAIDIYPNPFQDQVYLQRTYGCDTLNVRVYDMTGRIVFSNKFVSCPAGINTNGWNNGLYLFIVEDEMGNIIQKVKVIKV